MGMIIHDSSLDPDEGHYQWEKASKGRHTQEDLFSQLLVLSMAHPVLPSPANTVL